MHVDTAGVKHFDNARLMFEIEIDAVALARLRLGNIHDPYMLNFRTQWLEAELAEAKRRGLEV